MRYNGGTAPTNIKRVVFAPNVTSICHSAFQGCKRLTYVTIPPNTNITSVGWKAFRGCTSLESITFLPPSVRSIGGYAFSDCTSITAITIPLNIKSIAEFTFSNCGSLTAIDIPPNVTFIGHNAFHLCQSLATVNISSPVISIDANAFQNCESFTEISFPPNMCCLTVFKSSDCELSGNVYDYDILPINANIGTLVNAINTHLPSNANKVYCLSATSKFSKRFIDFVFSNEQKNEETFSIINEKQIGGGNLIAYDNVVALYVNWDQWAEHSGRSPLHGAAEANLCWNELNPILQRDKAAILDVDPKTNMEAFMLAAVGSDSKLESVYALLENHPAAVIPFIG